MHTHAEQLSVAICTAAALYVLEEQMSALVRRKRPAVNMKEVDNIMRTIFNCLSSVTDKVKTM